MENYLTAQEIALLLEVKVDTVRRWLRKGMLKGKALGRAGYRVAEIDFQAFMHQRQDNTDPPDLENTPPTAHKSVADPQDLFAMQINADLIDFSPNAIIVRDSMSVILGWSKGAERLYGWSASEAKGKITHQLLETKFPDSRENVDLELIQNGVWEGELHHVSRTGSLLLVMSRQKLMRNDSGLPYAILEINQDITEQRKTEEALHYLVEAGQNINSSLDFGEVINRVASLMVPYLADSCFFDLLMPDGTLQRAGLSGRKDLPGVDFSQAVNFVPTLEAKGHPVIRALNQGTPQIVSFIDDAAVHEMAFSDAHLRFLRDDLHLQSLMSIPLVARERVLGVLTFSSTSYSGRHYTKQDIDLAVTLGTRAAFAVDNARLYQEAQEEIFERKKAEEERQKMLEREHQVLETTALAQTEAEAARQRLYSLFQQAPAIICLLRGPDHVFELANPNYLQLVGRVDLLGKPIRAALPELAGQDFFELLDTVYQTGQEYKGNELKVALNRNGTGTLEEHFMNFVYQPTRNLQGEIDGILVYAVDITEQVRARQNLDRLFSVSLDLLCLATLDGRFLRVNPAFERVLGYRQEEFEGRSFLELIHPDDLERTINETEQLKIGVPTFYFENRYRCKDGTYKWLAWTSLPVPEEGITYATARDITEQKDLEERKDTFISSASHELRTPITAIKGNLQLAERRVKKLMRLSALNTSKEENDIVLVNTLITRALRQIEVQNRLINDLMDASRIHADKLTVSRELCNLVDIVRNVVDDQKMVTPDRNIILDLPQPEEVTVNVDADRIAQVINNYLTNALKYSPLTAPVYVYFAVEKQDVRVFVRDEGPGLSEVAQKRIWERFFQVQGIEGHHGVGGAGLGLGLNICQALVRMHDGEVGIESTVGKGSTFWFTLPLASVSQTTPDELTTCTQKPASAE